MLIILHLSKDISNSMIIKTNLSISLIRYQVQTK